MDKKQDRERGIQPENHCHLRRRKKGGESYESAEQTQSHKILTKKEEYKEGAEKLEKERK